MIEYDYVVSILGRNYTNGEWSPDLEVIMDGPGRDLEIRFDSYEDAVKFLENDVTPNQALEWERFAGCNGLDITIYEEKYEDCVFTGEYDCVGDYAWIGGEKDNESDYGKKG